MGSERWANSTTQEKVRVGLEMGLEIHGPANRYQCGIAAFVPRLPL
jgi:hypothetical protein